MLKICLKYSSCSLKYLGERAEKRRRIAEAGRGQKAEAERTGSWRRSGVEPVRGAGIELYQ
jgi:hypothetical protein